MKFGWTNPTYMDCWRFIAPLIPTTTDFAQDVYAMTFLALKEAEERWIAEKRKEGGGTNAQTTQNLP